MARVELHAFGDDEFHPISKTGSNLTSSGGVGYTIVDTLDTLILMGLDDELARAQKWVRDKLSFDRDGDYNVFEVRHIASAVNIVPEPPGPRRSLSGFWEVSYPHTTYPKTVAHQIPFIWSVLRILGTDCSLHLIQRLAFQPRK